MVLRRVRFWMIVMLALVLGCSGWLIGHRQQRGSSVHYLGLAGMESLAASGSADAYMVIKPSASGIAGTSSQTLKVPISTLSWSITTPTDADTGQSSGRPTVGSLVVNRTFDRYTPNLLGYEADDEVLPQVQIVFSRAVRGQSTETLSYQLTNAEVVGEHESVGGSHPTETLDLTAEKVQLSYKKGGVHSVAIIERTVS